MQREEQPLLTTSQLLILLVGNHYCSASNCTPFDNFYFPENHYYYYNSSTIALLLCYTSGLLQICSAPQYKTSVDTGLAALNPITLLDHPAMQSNTTFVCTAIWEFLVAWWKDCAAAARLGTKGCKRFFCWKGKKGEKPAVAQLQGLMHLSIGSFSSRVAKILTHFLFLLYLS